MANKDYYAILGVSEGVSLDELKKTYRKLALRYHPDRVPEREKKKAEERFKEISEAYYVLGDPERRKEYDELRRRKTVFKDGFAYQSGFDFEELLRRFGTREKAAPGRRYAGKYEFFEDLSDIFENLYRNEPAYSESATAFSSDYRAQLRIPKSVAEHGGTVEFSFNGDKRIKLKIKAGIKDGQKLRLRDQGELCPSCEHRGDLILTVHVG